MTDKAHKTPCDDPSCPQFLCENRYAHLPQLKQTANTETEKICPGCGKILPAAQPAQKQGEDRG
jgi:hypothetical protein